MILEVIVCVVVAVVLKAFFESNLVKTKRKTYNHPVIQTNHNICTCPFCSNLYFGFLRSLPAIKRFLYKPKRYLVIAYYWLVYWLWKLKLRQSISRFHSGSAWNSEELFSKISRLSKTNHLICFNGFVEEGDDVTEDTAFSLKLFRKSNDVAELYLFLRIRDHGFLQLPEHPEPATCITSSKKDVFKANGVEIELIERDRKWRIVYRGMMRMVDTTIDPHLWSKGKNMIFVKFSFTWKAFSSVYNFSENMDIQLWSAAVAREPWNWNFFRKMRNFNRDRFQEEQWGQLNGRIYIDGMDEGLFGRYITLRGSREHQHPLKVDEDCHRYMKVNAHIRSGLSLSLVVVCTKDCLTHSMSGYVVSPYRKLHPIVRTDLCLWKHGENGKVPKVIQFNVHTRIGSYNVVCLPQLNPSHFLDHNSPGIYHQCFSDIYIDSIVGRGVVELYYCRSCVSLFRKRKPNIMRHTNNRCSIDQSQRLILPLSDWKSSSQSLVGDRVSDLIRLTTLASAQNSVEFCVPDGFCVTMNALEKHLKQNVHLSDSIKAFHRSVRQGKKEEIGANAKICAAAFDNSNLPPEVASEIKEGISALKKNMLLDLRVLVMSSLEETSRYQVSKPVTYYNLTCTNRVLSAVVECWAAQFSYDALQSRRHQGFSLTSKMGILVQSMIEQKRASGEFFSCHSETGNPSQMIVKPNYQGCCYDNDEAETDYFVMSKRDEEDYEVVRMGNRDNRRGEEEIDPRKKLLLSYDDLFKLAKISDFIKAELNSDIRFKWSISPHGKIHVLEVNRLDIKSLENNADLIQEFDSAHAHDDVVLIPLKYHEILPLVSTPLTSSVVLRAVSLGLQMSENETSGNNISECIDVGVNVKRGRTFLDLRDIALSNSFHHFIEDQVEDKYRTIIDEESDVMIDADESQKSSIVARLWSLLRLLLKIGKSMNSFIQLTQKSLALEWNQDTSKELYDQLSQNSIQLLANAMKYHVICSVKHNILQRFLQFVLVGHRGAINDIHTKDLVAIYGLLSPSSDLPDKFQELSAAVQKEKDEFLAMKPLRAIEWMRNQTYKVKQLYEEFLAIYGHHCFNSCEFREQSWCDDETKIITAIQALVENLSPIAPKQRKFDMNALIGSLKSPLNMMQSFMLKLLIPPSIDALAQFHQGKSMFLQNLHIVKQGYAKLALLLKQETKLPDEDLMYFLTHTELKELIETHSPQLIEKSISRRHVYIEQLKNNEKSDFLEGDTSLCSEILSNVQSDSSSMKGIAMCTKNAEGPARVVKDDNEAFLIQAGDILIVPSPDIAWTIYYPLLAGIIIETGSIHSIAASMARGYEIACVVGVHGAMETFTSGELLSIDGGKGRIERVRAAE